MPQRIAGIGVPAVAVRTGIAGTLGEHSNTQGQSHFFSLLKDALANANDLQLDAERAVRALALGEAADIHTVAIATAKADLALQLTLQIRNKAIEAYQEISRMQI